GRNRKLEDRLHDCRRARCRGGCPGAGGAETDAESTDGVRGRGLRRGSITASLGAGSSRRIFGEQDKSMTDLSMSDFGRIPQYASYVARDPFRHGLHFPAVVSELGGLQRRILDVGSGDGLFSRLMAREGAIVVAYDKSPEKIAE